MVLLPLKLYLFAPHCLLLYPEDGCSKILQKLITYLPTYVRPLHFKCVCVCLFLSHYKLVLNYQFWHFSFYWYPWVTGTTLLLCCHHLQFHCIPIFLHPVVYNINGIRAISILFITTNSLHHIFILFIVCDHIFIWYFPIFLIKKLPNITVTWLETSDSYCNVFSYWGRCSGW
jgi:hypothetical protein